MLARLLALACLFLGQAAALSTPYYNGLVNADISRVVGKREFLGCVCVCALGEAAAVSLCTPSPPFGQLEWFAPTAVLLCVCTSWPVVSCICG